MQNVPSKNNTLDAVTVTWCHHVSTPPCIYCIVIVFSSPSFRLHKLLQEPGVHSRVRRQLGVEARAQHVALAHRDNVARIVLDVGLGDDRLRLGLVDAVGEGRDDGDARGLLSRRGEDLFDDGGADEDAIKGLGLGVGQEGQVEGRDEALDLAAKVVAVDADVEAADELLAALFGGVGLFGEEDEAGAGAPGGLLEDPETKVSISRREDEDVEVAGEGVTYLTNWRRGSRRPDWAATKEMVVLSPPGMMRASQRASSSGVRTSMASMAVGKASASWAAALRTRATCSAKPPWRARTPTVVVVGCIAKVKGAERRFQRGKPRRWQ